MAKKIKIVIDPGHCGKPDPGAVSKNGTRESDINLSVGRLVVDMLEKNGYEVLITREEENDPSTYELKTRTDLANQVKANLFISLHCNACDNPDAHGVEVWTTPGETNADKFADILLQKIHSKFPRLYMRTDISDGDLDKEEKFYVLKNTVMPAVLLEMEFLTNRFGEERLLDENFQKEMSESIANAVDEYFRR
jgi:N-acetylmuramoyl-L-alanine amidase